MAQQLVAQGEQVAFLGILESWLPQSVEFHASYRFPKLRRLQNNLHHQVGILKEAGWQSWVDYVKEKSTLVLEQRNNIAILGRETSERNRDVVTASNYRAFCKYKPRRYPGPVMYFLASDREEVDEIEDPRLDWEELCPNGFEVFRVNAGSSGEMLKLPHVQILANQLREVLSSLQKN